MNLISNILINARKHGKKVDCRSEVFKIMFRTGKYCHNIIHESLVGSQMPTHKQQLLQLRVHAMHAQPVCHRGKELQRFCINPFWLSRAHVYQCLNIVKKVRELYDDDAHAFSHSS